MAVRLASFEFTPRPGRPPKYPWGEWSDGSIWRAFKGEDFDSDPELFAQSCYRVAKKKGLRARAQVDREQQCVTFQFYGS